MKTLFEFRGSVLPRVVLSGLLMLGASPSAMAEAAKPMKTIGLMVANERVMAEVAITPEQKTRGLMGRLELPKNGGMLFVFETARRECMWMKNTPLALTVAFIDAQGAVLNLARMAPMSETIHCSSGPAAYALEMAQGWMESRGVKPGDVIAGLPPRGTER